MPADQSLQDRRYNRDAIDQHQQQIAGELNQAITEFSLAWIKMLTTLSTITAANVEKLFGQSNQ